MNEEILLREWQTVGPADDERLACQTDFTAEEAKFVAELSRSSRMEILAVRGGLRISTRSYVGLVRLGATTLHIRPKLAELSPVAMATFLRYALGMDMVSSWNTDVSVPLEGNGFADFLALALLEEVNALLRTGVLRDYETRTAWRSSPRGRIDLMELARHPMRGQTALAIPCRVSERVTDVVLNRVVNATLNAARALVTDRAIAFDLHSRAALLGELCQTVPLTNGLLSEAFTAIDRRSSHYQPVLEIAALIMQGLGTTIDHSNKSIALSSFLLDMNLLFERFVSRLLSDYGSPELRVETQVSQGLAFKWRENPFGWHRPRLRPDIILYDKSTNKPRMILDAKYKPIGAARRPSPEDLYQLTLYSLSFSQHGYVPARIIYPSTASGPALPAPCLDFQGMSANRTLASISFHGLPMVSIGEALRLNNDAALRQMVHTLCQIS